jgi:raffinose/stachyose/melibiose transport system permease protein
MTDMTTASVPAAQAGTHFNWRQPVIYVVALTAILISIIPVLYIWISGFRTSADLNASPGGWPNPWFLGNYANVLSSPRFWGSVFSSSLVAVGTTAGVVVLGLCAAYVSRATRSAGASGSTPSSRRASCSRSRWPPCRSASCCATSGCTARSSA